MQFYVGKTVNLSPYEHEDTFVDRPSYGGAENFA
jgi:hypothetical protein